MNFYFIFINLISLAVQKDLILLIENIFNNHENEKINMDYCKQYANDSFHYKEIQSKIKDIKSIINSEQPTELNKYKYIYISEANYLENITLFQKSTIFFVPDSIIKSLSALDNMDYCIIILDTKFEKNKPLIFTTDLDESISNKDFEFLILFIAVFYCISLPITIIVNFKSCCLKLFDDIFVNIISRSLISYNNILPMTWFATQLFLFPYIFYCLYKSYLYINLLFLLDGFTILNHENTSRFKYGKTLLCFTLFESIISLFFLFCIPFNCFYLFTIKNWIYHIFLLIMALRSIKKSMIPLYRQLRFEQSLKTFFAIGYKAKLIVYIKVIVFSIIYSLTFIILPFFQIIYVNKIRGAFYINYFITIGCEMILSFFLSILFFPTKTTIFYYLPVVYDYNTRYFSTIISEKNETINKISKLSKTDLKKKYSKKNIPIVLIKPFNIKNNSYNDLFIGKIEESK